MSSRTITAGGLTWTVGEPQTQEPVAFDYKGKCYKCRAVKATSDCGSFFVIDYEVRMWRPKHRPLERNATFVLDSQQRLMVCGRCVEDCLRWLATNHKAAPTQGGFDPWH
jgi:hypothetical protein